MIYRHSAIALGLLVVFTVLLSQNVLAQDTVHVVQRGDTLFSLSRRYQVSQEDIMRHNGITDASRIQIGMRLNIPGPSVPGAAAAAAFSEYRVSPNETLFRIAQNHGITVQALRDMNGFSRDRVLRAGEIIRVPRPSAGYVAASPPRPPPVTPPPPPPARPIQNQPPAPVRRASLSVRWPVAAREAVHMNGILPGVLVLGDRNESVRSLTRGTVITAGPYRGFGNIVIVEKEGGYMYIYGSLETVSVRQGDRVLPGTELGKLGIYAATGRPELVFLVFRNGIAIDPVTAPRAL